MSSSSSGKKVIPGEELSYGSSAGNAPESGENESALGPKEDQGNSRKHN